MCTKKLGAITAPYLQHKTSDDMMYILKIKGWTENEETNSFHDYCTFFRII